MSEEHNHKEAAPGIKAIVSLKEDLVIAQGEFLKLKKEFSEITYQFSLLYDRWSVEHQYVGKREAEMLRSIEAFNKQVEVLEDRFQGAIEATTAQSAAKVWRLAEREIKKYTELQYHGIAARLENVVAHVERISAEYAKVQEAYAKVQETTGLKTMACLMFISFLTGAACTAWFGYNTISFKTLFKNYDVYKKHY